MNPSNPISMRLVIHIPEELDLELLFDVHVTVGLLRRAVRSIKPITASRMSGRVTRGIRLPSTEIPPWGALVVAPGNTVRRAILTVIAAALGPAANVAINIRTPSTVIGAIHTISIIVDVHTRSLRIASVAISDTIAATYRIHIRGAHVGCSCALSLEGGDHEAALAFADLAVLISSAPIAAGSACVGIGASIARGGQVRNHGGEVLDLFSRGGCGHIEGGEG